MADDSSLSLPYVFRGVAYIVTVILQNGQLIIEVEERVTTNRWKGTFSSLDIEELTQKSGHYEKFLDFANLLKSAVTQSTESVTLDLLTCSDLKLMHSSRTGLQTTTTGKQVPDNNKKRYLLLIHSVGPNSKCMYPLKLSSADPIDLREIVCTLQKENDLLRKRLRKDRNLKEVEMLKKDYNKILKEKEEVEAEFLEYQQEMETMSGGERTTKEMKMLKSVIKKLEEELMSLKSEQQRLFLKKNDKYRKVINELDEVKASERNLRVRVRSLTNELAQYKRNGSRSFPNSMFTRQESRNSSRTSTQSNGSRDLSQRSQNRSNRSKFTSRSSSRESRLSSFNAKMMTRDRSSSRESCLSSRKTKMTSHDRSSSRDRLRSSNTSAGSSYQMKSPSSSGSRTPRFNPTAYKAEKDRQRNETELKHKRAIRAKLSGKDIGKKTRMSSSDLDSGHELRNSRTPSVDSIQSIRSSFESLSDIPLNSDTSQGHKKLTKNFLRLGMEQNGCRILPPSSRSKASGKILSSTPDNSLHMKSTIDNGNKENVNSDVINFSEKSSGILEINRRLHRVQQFLNEIDLS